MRPIGLVASGHPGTSAAMADVLRAGGNAHDAVVAGVLAAAVAEPCLTSPGGGGFLMTRTASGEEVVLDCFVAAPGMGAAPPDPSGLVRVPVEFGHAVQDFHVGPASVAVPGVLAGCLAIHERWGRLDLARVVGPAVALARDGVEVDAFGAQLLGLLAPILSRNATGRGLFFRGDRPLRPGERFTNPALAQFLADVGAGHRHGLRADEIGGAVTAADVDAYRVIERAPRRTTYRDAVVLTNPPPSFGGALVDHALGRLVDGGPLPQVHDPAGAVRVADALVSLAAHRATLGPGSTRGTTHLSVADADGNVAAMTTSNGSGSGEFAGDTGVQLNNVMGEEDLHPGGFWTGRPGDRVGSMMCPTLLECPDGRTLAFGSGGSERIRSALTQVVVGVVDHAAPLAGAVLAPRMHWDGERLQVEPGLPPEVLEALGDRWEINVWSRADLYFGGVHGVGLPDDAVGDPRRGGVGAVVRGDVSS